jgi:RNA polymerase sigma factor (sigma-70 family)
LEDATLVRRMLEGDERAFDEFFDIYFDRVFRFALRRTRDEDAAEEVAQATLVRAMRKLGTWRGEASLFTWLCAICRREQMTYWTKRNTTARGPADTLDRLPAPTDGPEQAMRRAVAGVSGWISYSFSRTRYTDKYAGERFYADYDQRHTFSGYAQYRLSPVTSLSAKLRFGSNFPIPGYLERRAEAIFLASARNQVRLPTYARLDLRANRAFNFDRRRLTLFVEVINVVGRTNYTTDAFRVLPSGQVLGATQRLFPFLPTAGISFDF